MRQRRVTTALLAALMAVVLGACSSGGSLTGNEKHAISDFRAGANSICKSAFDSLRALRQNAAAQVGSTTPTASDAAAQAKDYFVRSVIPVYDRLVGDLHNLGEPTLDRGAWDDIMRQVDQRLSDIKASVDADPVKALATFQRAPTKDAIDQAFISFGAAECGNSA